MAAKKHSRKEGAYQRPAGVRPFWSGTITFGLVSVPVNLFPAQRHNKVGLRMLAPDGTPLARRFYCPVEGVEVHAEHIVRGYEVADDEYVVVRDEELEALQPRKSHDIDLQRFVDRADLPPLFFERAYFLTPAGDSNKAYRLLAEAMEKEERAGIATFVMRGKEYLVAILAEHGILRAETLRFADEVRSPADVGLPKQGALDGTLQDQFAKSIARLTRDTLPVNRMADERLKRLNALVERKRKQRKNLVRVESVAVQEGEESDGAAVDLLESIRRQLAQSAANGHGKSSAGNSRHKKPAENGRGKMSDGNGRGKESSEGLEELSKDQLYARAQELEIEGRSKMTKSELIDAISRN